MKVCQQAQTSIFYLLRIIEQLFLGILEDKKNDNDNDKDKQSKVQLTTDKLLGINKAPNKKFILEESSDDEDIDL